MENYTGWGASIGHAFTQLIERLAQYLPSLLAAFALLLIGWFAARILRSLAIRLTLVVDAHVEPGVLTRTRLGQTSR